MKVCAIINLLPAIGLAMAFVDVEDHTQYRRHLSPALRAREVEIDELYARDIRSFPVVRRGIVPSMFKGKAGGSPKVNKAPQGVPLEHVKRPLKNPQQVKLDHVKKPVGPLHGSTSSDKPGIPPKSPWAGQTGTPQEQTMPSDKPLVPLHKANAKLGPGPFRKPPGPFDPPLSPWLDSKHSSPPSSREDSNGFPSQPLHKANERPNRVMASHPTMLESPFTSGG